MMYQDLNAKRQQYGLWTHGEHPCLAPRRILCPRRNEERDREISGVCCVKCSCITAMTMHLQLYNSVFSKTMLMVTGRILLHFYDCSNIITLWPLYAPVKCIAITCENGLTPNRCQAIVVIKCADVCIKAPQKTVCWKSRIAVVR